MRKRRKAKVERIVGYGSLVLLSIITLGLLFPIVGIGANAEELTTSLTTQTSVYLYSTIALSTSDNIAVDIVPKAGGRVEVGTADVFVSTNNTTGYSISLSAVNPSNRLEQVDQTLSFENDHQSYGINPLSTKTTYANYLDSPANINTWGYALTSGEADGSTEYEGLTNTSNTVKNVNSTASNDRYKLNVAVAVDTSLPAGSYRNGLIVTAVANPITLRGFNSIYYMQQMTPEICNEIVIPEGELAVTGELVDKRDNTIYQVAKLKDGNCWMTQNLALDLTVGEVLTADTTDLANTESKSWTVAHTTETVVPTQGLPYQDTKETYSWSAGKIVLTNPTQSENCLGSDYDTVKAGQSLSSLAEVCPQYFKDVSSGWTADASVYTPTSSIDETTKRYDPHYLIGNYYQYGAATAGTGIGISSPSSASTNPDDLVNASGSICPKGWTLPRSGNNRNGGVDLGKKDNDGNVILNGGVPFDIDGSFFGLLKSYGYSGQESDWTYFDGSAYTSILGRGTGEATDLAGAPMYFARSGVIHLISGSLRHVGSAGYAWSSTAYPNSTNYAYNLDFSAAFIYPADDYYRHYGFPVRCVAK